MAKAKSISGGLCLIVSLIIFAVQQGCSVIGGAPSWLGGLIWYLIAVALMIYGIWAWDGTAKWGRTWKTVVSVAVLLLISVFLYGPLIRQYHAEYGPLRDDQPVIQVLVIPEDGDFEPGAKVGTIIWERNYSDALVRLANLTDLPLQNVEFTLQSDLHIAAITQTSGLSGVNFYPVGVPSMRLTGQDNAGKRIEIPVDTQHGMLPVYKVECTRLASRMSLELIVATVVVNRIEAGRPPPQLIGPKRRPSRFKIAGSYETSMVDKGTRHPIFVECAASHEPSGTCTRTLLFQHAR